MRLDRTLWPAVTLLALVLALFELTGLDLAVQDRLFDFAGGHWLVDASAPGPRAWFYTGPKVVIIAGGLGVLAIALGPARWRERLRVRRRDLWVAFLTLATVPLGIGQLKATTNVFCPGQTRRYGGDVPYVKVFERYPEGDRPARRGRCFPAGHASGGFALLALAGLARTRRGRVLGASVGLAAGWWMGGYQMAKGAHFLSHTLVTMLVAWIAFLLWRRALRARDERAAEV